MSKTILIVDDSNIMRLTLTNLLSETNYKVIEAMDGLDGLDKAVSAKIDLVISDVNMPNMDGLTFVQKLRELPQYKFVPVMMLTTVSDSSQMAIGKAAGVRAWMVKPLDRPKLLGAVSKVLGL